MAAASWACSRASMALASHTSPATFVAKAVAIRSLEVRRTVGDWSYLSLSVGPRSDPVR